MSKTFIIKNETLQQMFVELDGYLSQIEVKGDSVPSLFKSRMIIKDLFNQIKEVEGESDEI